MFDLLEHQRRLAVLAAATTNEEKGSSLENLCRYLFECIDGIEISEQDINLPSEEIDLVLWNPQIESVFKPWEFIILVECKNWNCAVGSVMLDNFISKLRRRQLKTGIFIASNGITGGFIHGDGNEPGATGIIASSLQEGIRVIVITLDEIKAITSIEDFKNLIKRKYCGLFVHRLL